MATDVLVISSEDWGCDYTPADLEAYEAAVAAEIVDAYPLADVRVETRGTDRTRVIVTTRSSDGQIDASLETARAEAEIEETAKRVCQSVFDAGDFWP